MKTLVHGRSSARFVVAVALAILGRTFCATAQDLPDDAEPVAAEESASGRFLWTDTSLSLLPYGWGFVIDADEQSTLTLEHAHESKIGDLFAFVDITRLHDSEGDAATWYGEVGPRFSLGKMLGKDLSHTFFRRSLFEFKDVLLATQYERGEDADVTEAFLIGVGVDLDVREAGLLGRLGKFNYMQLNFYGRAELADGARHGIRDMQVTLAASYPFKVGNTDLLLDGYFDWVTGFGSEDWSFHLNPQLTMDLGARWNEPAKLYLGVEVDLWWNKYQIRNSAALDTNQTAVSILLKYHF